jgi:acetylornithine deacetylase
VTEQDHRGHRVAARVDPRRIERDLAALVRIPSITGAEGAVQAAVADLMAGAGLAVERLAPEPEEVRADPDWPGEEMPRSTLPIVAGSLGRPGGRRLLLAGHVDVVPPGDPATWTVPIWDGLVRNGRLFGRGACDMKGGVVAALEAVRAVAESPARLEGQVVLLAVPSEEDGGQGMLAAIRAGFTADAAVITEPTDLAIVVAHAGAITFRLTVPGRAAHASKRREGVDALDALFVLREALLEDERRRNETETDPLMTALGLPYPTIIGKVEGGEWASTVLDRVVAEGRYGVRLGQTWRDAEADLRACVAAACEADPWLRDHPAVVEITGGRFSSARVPSDHPMPVGLADAAESVLGRRPPAIGEPYGADMRLLVNEGRTPTVMFGPGDVAVAHSADESVPLDQVADCARVLAAWIVAEVGAC